MCAEILAFPSTRRHRFVQKLAAQNVRQFSTSCGANIARPACSTRGALARKGIPAHSISGDVRAIEAAARAEIWRRALRGHLA
jgi:hypothetical protein